jgi:hypothetical protein
MTDAGEGGGEARGLAGFERGFDGHWRRQVRRGLALTPAQRLRWLEQTMEELRPFVGRARFARPISTRDPRAA